MAMYDEWPLVELNGLETTVLGRFTPGTGKLVAAAVVRELAQSVNAETVNESVLLDTDHDVMWTMQIVGYGLSLPFSTDYETIRDCVKLYSSWLTCIRPEPHPTVPRPIVEQPCRYSRDIVKHLQHLFVPRNEQLTGQIVDSAVILRQAKEAHYLLRCLQSLVMQSRVELQDEIWPEILKFLLTVNDQLLSIPFEPDDISFQLSSRILSVLFELWLYACGTGQFPSPPYWKTFHIMCKGWRHHVALIDQWIRTCLVLSHHLINDLCGQDYSKIIMSEELQNLLPKEMNTETINQTWFRILHLLDNPAYIPGSEIRKMSQSSADNSTDSIDNSCMAQLPYCFFRALAGLRLIVDSFLGESVNGDFLSPDKLIKDWSELIGPSVNQSPVTGQNVKSSSQLPAQMIKSAFGIQDTQQEKTTTKHSGHKTSSHNIKYPEISRLPPSTLVFACLKAQPLKLNLDNSVIDERKPKVDHLLNLFGSWLFASAIVKHSGKTFVQQEDNLSVHSVSSMSESESVGSAPKEMRKSTTHIAVTMEGVSGIVAGKAEAVGILCKLFCSKGSDETIIEQYLVKFYSVLLEVLVEKDKMVLSSLLFYGANLFRIGLKGMQLLVPNFLDAIEFLVAESERSALLHPSMTETDVRRACLSVFASLISLPTYYGVSGINDLTHNTERHTFIGLRSKLLRALLHSLKNETDSHNIQWTLGLSALFCHESALWENCDKEDRHDGYCRQAVQSVLSMVCDNLCKNWTNDYPVCLAALDCLSVLAFLPDKNLLSVDDTWSHMVVSSLCKFIEFQLNRPPRSQTTTLHSTVVAAFSCLQTWITQIPEIVENEALLRTISETVELGVSGTKNQVIAKITAGVSSKTSTSQRVHDVAEQLLQCIFGNSGLSSPSNEVEEESWLLSKFGMDGGKFNYYYIDNCTIIGVLEMTDHNQNTKGFPSCAILIRSPFYGIRSYNFTLEPRPPGHNRPPDWVERPVGVERQKQTHELPLYFPAEIEQMNKCKADSSMPILNISDEAEKVRQELREAIKKEKWAQARPEQFQTKDLKPPPPSVNCDVGRLLLQDLGYLDPAKLGSKTFLLNSNNDELTISLSETVDKCPSRVILTAHLFYVKSGQTQIADILENGLDLSQTCAQYCRFLSQLGSGMEMDKHRHWTGHWSTAFDTPKNESKTKLTALTLDGIENGLYWSSLLAEIAFLVPSQRSYKLTSLNHSSPLTEHSALKESKRNAQYRFTDKVVTFRKCSAIETTSRQRAVSLEEQNRKTSEPTEQERKSTRLTQLKSLQPNKWGSQPTLAGQSVDNPKRKSVIKSLFRRPTRPKEVLREFTVRRRPSNSEADQIAAQMEELNVEWGTTWYDEVDSAKAQASTPPEPGAPPVRPPRNKSSHELSIAERNSKAPTRVDSGKGRKNCSHQNFRIMIVWLEKFEDYTHFPTEDLLPLTDMGEEMTIPRSDIGIFVIFIHPLSTGLYRLKLQGPWGKLGVAGPLIDGTVISEGLLPIALRQTVLSIGRRRALEQEGYILPYVRRKQKIQEVAGKFALKSTPPDFLYQILTKQ